MKVERNRNGHNDIVMTLIVCALMVIAAVVYLRRDTRQFVVAFVTTLRPGGVHAHTARR